MQDASLSSYYSHLISAVSAAAAAIGKCRNDEVDAQSILEQHISLVWKDGGHTASGPPAESTWSSLPPRESSSSPARPPWGVGSLQRRVDFPGETTPKGGVLVPAGGGGPRGGPHNDRVTSSSGGYAPLILYDRGRHLAGPADLTMFSSPPGRSGQSGGHWTQCGVCGGQCGQHHPSPMTSLSSRVSVRRVLREFTDAQRSSTQRQSSETENTFQRQPTSTSISDRQTPQNHRDASKTTEPHRKPLPSATTSSTVNSRIQPPAPSSSTSTSTTSSSTLTFDIPPPCRRPPSIIVGYYYCDEPIPYRTTICGTTQPTLAQFKQLLTTKTGNGKDGHFRYFFKKASNEFEGGVVREEVSDDRTILPQWEGKIVCKIERSS